MAKRRKSTKPRETEGEHPPPAPRIGTTLGDKLREVRPAGGAEPEPPRAPAKPRPRRPPERADDMVIRRLAYADVTPLARPGGRAPRPRSPTGASAQDDAQVRARMGALVAGGVHFRVQCDPSSGHVSAVRAGVRAEVAEALGRKACQPEVELDLHGLGARQVGMRVERFVREQHRRGSRILRIICGKGLHSESGVDVLRDALLASLTEGGAAPLVRAFASAHPTRGGTGAVVVELMAR